MDTWGSPKKIHESGLAPTKKRGGQKYIPLRWPLYPQDVEENSAPTSFKGETPFWGKNPFGKIQLVKNA